MTAPGSRRLVARRGLMGVRAAIAGLCALGLAAGACGGGGERPAEAPPAVPVDGPLIKAPAWQPAWAREATAEKGQERPRAISTSTDDANGATAPELLREAPATEPAAAPEVERSDLLPSGFYNPMPGGVFAGYRADTGLDIAGSPRPVYAIAAGSLDYSEPGHTLWTGPTDTANCVRFKLDAPIPWKGRQITHVYYAHLSKLDYHQTEGSKERRRIQGGERLGLSGKARGSPHLHIGLLLDGEVEQYSGTFLFENEIRELLGGYKNGKALPKEDAAKEPEPAR